MWGAEKSYIATARSSRTPSRKGRERRPAGVRAGVAEDGGDAAGGEGEVAGELAAVVRDVAVRRLGGPEAPGEAEALGRVGVAELDRHAEAGGERRRVDRVAGPRAEADDDRPLRRDPAVAEGVARADGDDRRIAGEVGAHRLGRRLDARCRGGGHARAGDQADLEGERQPEAEAAGDRRDRQRGRGAPRRLPGAARARRFPATGGWRSARRRRSRGPRSWSAGRRR